jgi:hypothetical protein
LRHPFVLPLPPDHPGDGSANATRAVVALGRK